MLYIVSKYKFNSLIKKMWNMFQPKVESFSPKYLYLVQCHKRNRQI